MTNGPLIVIGLAGGLFSLGMVIAANTFYSKIGTYHPVNWLHDKNKKDTEPAYLKILKLSIYNFIIAISVTGLLFVYTAFPIGGESLFGISEGKALVAASIVMNGAIRIGSLSKLTSDKLFDRALSFGYSFVLSIYFLSFFALSSYLLENQFSTEKIVIPAIPEGEIPIIVMIVILGPVVSALISEAVLAVTGVDKDKQDDFSREELSIL